MRKLPLWMLLSALSTTALAGTLGLPFIEDDYGKALATARQRRLPIFVEVSAPW